MRVYRFIPVLVAEPAFALDITTQFDKKGVGSDTKDCPHLATLICRQPRA